MSLLNEALRKRDDEQDQQKKPVSFLDGPPPLKTNRSKLYRILVSVVLIVGILAVVCYKRFFYEGAPSVQAQVATSSPLQEEVPSNSIAPSTPASLSPLSKEDLGRLSDEKERDNPVVLKQSKQKEGSTERSSPPGSEVAQGQRLSPSSSKTGARVPLLSGHNDSKSVIPEKPRRQGKKKAKLNKIVPHKKISQEGSPPRQTRRSETTEIIKSRQGERLQKAPQRTLPDMSENPFYRKALSYHRLGQMQMAITMYLDVLKKNPEHHDAAFNLASAYIETFHFSNASPILERLRELDPENPQVVLNLGLAEIGLGRSRKALNHLKEAERLNGPGFEIYFHRGMAFSQIGRLDKAIAWYKRAEGISRDKPLLLFNMAVCCDKSRKYKEALRYYLAFLRQSPSSSDQLQEIQRRITTLKAYLSIQANEVVGELQGLTGR